MKNYVRNILLYLVTLLGILSFIAMFSNCLQIYDSVKCKWTNYNVRVYLGVNVEGTWIYRGAVLPIFGFVFPLLCGIVLIIESFHQDWLAKIKFINTILATIIFISAILVLLTKEIFLNVNNLGETNLLRNGSGPIFSAICSWVAAILLLFVTWLPSHTEVEFIER